jgi:hypothetical protein
VFYQGVSNYLESIGQIQVPYKEIAHVEVGMRDTILFLLDLLNEKIL